MPNKTYHEYNTSVHVNTYKQAIESLDVLMKNLETIPKDAVVNHLALNINNDFYDTYSYAQNAGELGYTVTLHYAVSIDE